MSEMVTTANYVTLIEQMINVHAKEGCKIPDCNLCRKGLSVARRLNINPEHFQFYLSRNMGGSIRNIIPGPVVKIYLAWPECYEELNTIIESTLITIRDKKLRRPLELISLAIVHSAQDDMRRLLSKNRKHFNDESEIMMDLLPRTRLQIEESTTITLTDVKSGESISIVKKSRKTRFDGEDTSLWIQLSRIVRDKNPILESHINNETPELDKAIENE